MVEVLTLAIAELDSLFRRLSCTVGSQIIGPYEKNRFACTILK